VIVVLPVHPGADPKDVTTRIVMKHIYKTIYMGDGSLLAKLEQDFPGVKLTDYISFYSLRNYGVLANRPVTEQIYVHAKLMIVDDRTIIVGSANINDRSMVSAKLYCR
jgi:phospholipase D1/2